MKIRKTLPEKNNRYFLVKSAGGYSPCIKGNPENRPYAGSVLANCVGSAVGVCNELAGQGNCDIIGNLYPRAMKAWAKAHGYETGTTPRPGAILLWYGTGHEHVANVMKKSGSGWYIYESGWNFTKGTYCKYRKVTKAGNYGRSSKYQYQGCIYMPFIDPYETPTAIVIKEGQKGEKVRWMQWALNYEGCYATQSDSNVDGSFGPKTTKALKAFQKAHGLTADGKCGPKTQAIIKTQYTLT